MLKKKWKTLTIYTYTHTKGIKKNTNHVKQKIIKKKTQVRISNMNNIEVR